MQIKRALLQYREVQADEAGDPLAEHRAMIGRIAVASREHGGVPMPLQGLDLVMDPKFHGAAKLENFFNDEKEATSLPDIIVRNTFICRRRKQIVTIAECYGKIVHVIDRQSAPFDFLAHTLAAQDAWGIEQETKAQLMLAGLLSPRAFKCYLLTGTFVETSKRSGVIYVFRRLRPTLALSARSERVKIIATMCLHPIGYYDMSFAGVMVPTDDVIAHLMLMRGDEHMFWRRANQWAADDIRSAMF